MLRLFTDSDTDMNLQDCEKYGFSLISMPYIINDVPVYPYRDFETFQAHDFYEMLRKGTLPTTCALNVEEYKDYFEPVFQAGDDVLYVHFSAAMSGTFDALRLAKQELEEKYPGRKIHTIDTKLITIGSNAILREIGDMHANGATLDDILKWAEEEVDHFACYFYADTLKFFAKSGRVSGIAATMGSIFGVKPIIYMNAEGQMVNIGKEMGRTKALHKVVSYVESLQSDLDKHHVVVGHSDAPELAQKLVALLKEKFGENLQIDVVTVNPTAGSHCGPDTVGVAFHAIHR